MLDSEKDIRKTAKKIIKDKEHWSLAERLYAKMIRKRLKKTKEWSFRYFRHHYYTVSLMLNPNY